MVEQLRQQVPNVSYQYSTFDVLGLNVPDFDPEDEAIS